MPPKKTTKFHFKIKIAKKPMKPTKRRLFFYEENANDIPEDEEPHQHDFATVGVGFGVGVAPAVHLEAENSSVIAINDDSGCFSSDTSLKFSENTDETRNRYRKSKRLRVTQRTGIDGSSFWDINDSNQKAFIAIYVKKSLDESSKEPSPPPQCVSSVGKSEELPQEEFSAATVSVQVEGETFCLRTLGSIRENGKKRKRKADVQRKNEWKKFKFRY